IGPSPPCLLYTPPETQIPDCCNRSRSSPDHAAGCFLERLAPAGPCSSSWYQTAAARKLPSGNNRPKTSQTSHAHSSRTQENPSIGVGQPHLPGVTVPC